MLTNKAELPVMLIETHSLLSLQQWINEYTAKEPAHRQNHKHSTNAAHCVGSHYYADSEQSGIMGANSTRLDVRIGVNCRKQAIALKTLDERYGDVTSIDRPCDPLRCRPRGHPIYLHVPKGERL
jgi:hypothetical protein